MQWRTFCSFSKFIHPTSYRRGRVVRYVVSILGAIMSEKVFGSHLCHKMAMAEVILITQPTYNLLLKAPTKMLYNTKTTA